MTEWRYDNRGSKGDTSISSSKCKGITPQEKKEKRCIAQEQGENARREMSWGWERPSEIQSSTEQLKMMNKTQMKTIRTKTKTGAGMESNGSFVTDSKNGNLVFLPEDPLSVSGSTRLIGNDKIHRRSNQADEMDSDSGKIDFVVTSCVPPSSLDGGSAVLDPFAMFIKEERSTDVTSISQRGGVSSYSAIVSGGEVDVSSTKRRVVPKPDSSSHVCTPRMETTQVAGGMALLTTPSRIGTLPFGNQYSQTRQEEIASLALVSMHDGKQKSTGYKSSSPSPSRYVWFDGLLWLSC
jgi:hypothetical protein